MDGQYVWKKTEEIEIDLTDLLRRICRQWKRIAVCALVSAVFLGGYRWLKDSRESLANVPGTNMEEEIVLTETEERAIETAVELENEIRDLEKYLDSSVLMKLDPYHKNKTVMLYRIDHAKRQELQAVTESYVSYVLNGGAADALQKLGKRWKMDKSCLAELVSAYQKSYGSPYQIAVNANDNSLLSESLFYVEVTGMDTESARGLALDMQKVLEEYSENIKKAAGSHRLMLINSTESITADSGLQAQQRDKKSLLLSNKTNLETMTDAFNTEQMKVYKNAVGAEDENRMDGQEEESGEEIADRKNSAVVKYAFLGLFCGIFVYCGSFSFWYVFHDTIKSIEEMKRLYMFSIYGGIPLKSGDEKKGQTKSGMQLDAYEHAKAQVLNRIKLFCQKQKITKLCAASDFLMGEEEKTCLESIAGRLRDWGISMEVVEDASTDTNVWERLSETGNVLMVCRMGTTTHCMIDDAMDFYMQNDIAVIGAAVFLQIE